MNMGAEAGHRPRLAVNEDWREQAACRSTDPDFFFPVGTTGPAIKQIENAKAICRICDVQVDCLSYALNNHEDYGVWGGTSEQERRTIQNNRINGPRSDEGYN
jgi:WhiB family redox-sensing transcriptional regulator